MDAIEAAGWAAECYPSWAEAVDPWFAWSDQQTLEQAVDLDRDVLRRFAPSLVINDCRIPMVIAALAEGVPLVSVCQDNQIPGYSYDGSAIPATWTTPLPSINAVLHRLHLEPVGDDARWLFARGRIAVPSTPELEPICSPHRDGLDLVYTGLLTKPGPGTVDDPSDVLFYRTVGALDDDFRAAFGDWDGSIYIATGEARGSDCSSHDELPNLQVRALWDLDAIGPGLRAVVHHGGHGVTLRCIAEGVPAVVLPGSNPERSANGDRAERIGMATVMKLERDTGPVWGPAVDATGDRPPWSEVRRALDQLPARRLGPRPPNSADRPAAQVVLLLAAPSPTSKPDTSSTSARRTRS
jgi:hypothetical protein